MQNKKGNSEINVHELYEKRFKLKEQTLSILIKSLISLNKTAPKEIKVYFNIAAFINVISYDILVNCRDILTAESSWQKKHYSRQAALVIYESINDIFELLGKDFKTLTIKTLNKNSELNLNKFRSQLNHFKESYWKQLKEIRNAAIAHREQDAVKQLSSIISVDEEFILKITFEFETILHDLEKMLQPLFLDIKGTVAKD